MPEALKAKRALVTGAASGIGLAIARRFSKEGAALALVDRDSEALERARASFGRPDEVVFAKADVTNEVEVAAAFDKAAQQLGGLDTVVACAGVQFFERDVPVHELDSAVWRETLEVNLTGMFLTCKYAVRKLLSNGGGSITCLGSPTGLRGTCSGCHAYSTSKAGSFGLVRVMAADYAANGIRVNSLVPGFTDTPMVAPVMQDPEWRDRVLRRVPMRRWGRPEEIASVALFLASDEASFVTGAIYIADGGETVL